MIVTYQDRFLVDDCLFLLNKNKVKLGVFVEKLKIIKDEVKADVPNPPSRNTGDVIGDIFSISKPTQIDVQNPTKARNKGEHLKKGERLKSEREKALKLRAKPMKVCGYDDEDEMSEGFFEAIEELERMTRDPSDILEEMNSRLSARELQLVLVYFSQEGRDSWCALEVFEWLKKENKVDDETMELMVSLMCGWVRKMIESGNEIEDVIGVIVDMECVGLKPGFSMIEKVISLYWEMGEREKGVVFVKEVLRRGIGGGESGRKGGPTGYLAWKMMDASDK
ncbi:pentatricopeptide repeat-containing protein [Tanacetum coccineum]